MSPSPSIGDTLGPYQILSRLGAGGMGEVYRGRDGKLNRDVAIKFLPAALAGDAQYLARFEREAQLLAALNHPNIAAVYGIEQGALVMELVEGSDLQGPVPVETAIQYARQIALALEAAHEKGIIHRDLKPANIKVTPDGVVKLLDFGLAKAGEENTSAVSNTLSPTLSLAMTQAGMILGTAAYMSPEQARGKPVDKRCDIWSFGVVLFELLAGGMLYGGETVSDSMAAVITREPDWSSLPKDTPPHLRRLLMRCLRKDPKQRLRDIGEARILLDEPAESAPAAQVAAPPPARRNSWPVWALAACSALALLLGGMLWRATRPVEQPLQRFYTDMGPDAVAGTRMSAAISRDGTRLAYQVQQGGGSYLLATRLMDQSKSTILAGTEGAVDPFFSPDGQWIGFFADAHVKKVSVQGGAPTSLCELPALRGADWGEDGNLILGISSNSLGRIPASGGTIQRLGKLENGDISQRWPQILPGGEAILFTGHNASTGFDDANIYVLFLKTGKSKIVQRGGYFGRYLPSGHLVYLHQGTLFAVPFDLNRYETRGMPAPVLEDVAGNSVSGGGQMDFSRTGTLVYLSGKSRSLTSELFTLDAAGKKEPLLQSPNVVTPRVSPDGKRVAFSAAGVISVFDPARGSTTRLTSSTSSTSTMLAWAPDGKHIVYAASGLVWWIRADGSGQPQQIYQFKDSSVVPASFTPDGRNLAFHQSGTGTGRDLWTLPLDVTDPDAPKPAAPELFLATKGNDVEPAFSPDGKWLAYTTFESGTAQVFVRPFPEGAKGGNQAQISTVAGRFPEWSRTAKEIFYATLDGHIMVVPYSIAGRNFDPGKPREWSPAQIVLTGNNPPYDVTSDGKHIIAFPAAQAATGGDKVNLRLTFLLNFFDELKRRIPVH
jgi:Tol biopolymer transport system component